MKETYQKPFIEVIRVQNEGVIAGSGGTGVPDLTPDTWSSPTRSRSSNGGVKSHSYTSTMNEIEDILSNIFTY